MGARLQSHWAHAVHDKMKLYAQACDYATANGETLGCPQKSNVFESLGAQVVFGGDFLFVKATPLRALRLDITVEVPYKEPTAGSKSPQ